MYNADIALWDIHSKKYIHKTDNEKTKVSNVFMHNYEQNHLAFLLTLRIKK